MIQRDPQDESLQWTSLPKSSLLSLINGDNFGFFNRELAHKIGLNEAIIFSELVARYQFLEKKENLTEIGEELEYFQFTMEDLQERTCLGRKSQDRAINHLIQLGWLEKKNHGLPMKRYFRIHIDKIWELDSIQKKFTKLSKRDKLVGMKGTPSFDQKGQPVYIYKTSLEKEEIPPTSESDSSGAKAPPPSAKALELSIFLLKKLKEIKPDLKEPHMPIWISQMDKMMRIDKRTVEAIEEVIEWLPTHDFWRTKILSPEKLRKQFDALELEMRRKASKTPQDRIKEVQGYIESHPKKEVLKRALQEGKISLEDAYIEKIGVFQGSGSEDQFINFMDHNAKERIDQLIRQMST